LSNRMVSLVAEASEGLGNGWDLSYDVESDAEFCLDWHALSKAIQHIVFGIAAGGTEGEIHMTVIVARGQIRIRIRDPKIQTDEVNPAALFDVFSDGSDDSATKYGGVGISLALGLKFAQFIGGNVSVENDLGTRRVFVMTIPAGVATAGAMAAA